MGKMSAKTLNLKTSTIVAVATFEAAIAMFHLQICIELLIAQYFESLLVLFVLQSVDGSFAALHMLREVFYLEENLAEEAGTYLPYEDSL